MSLQIYVDILLTEQLIPPPPANSLNYGQQEVGRETRQI